MRHTFEVFCEGHDHRIELHEDDGDVIVEFLDHEDIEKDALIASMRGTRQMGDCFDVFADVTGGDGKGLSFLLDNEAWKGHDKTASLLLEAGADPDEQDEYGRTPLHFAARNGHDKVVALLLEAGADPDAQDDHGRTPLHFAAKSTFDKVVVLLLKAGADTNVKNKDGETPLHKAEQYERHKTVALLKKYGAEG